MPSKTARWLPMALIALALSSCSGSAEPGPPCSDPNGGTFVGTTQGSQLRGCASYGVASSGGSQNTVLLVSVGPQTAPAVLVSLARAGVRPSIGTYPIGTNSGDFSGIVQMGSGGTFSVTAGDVTIEASSAGDLAGSFNVTATQSGSGNAVSVSGTFTAVCTPGGSVTC